MITIDVKTFEKRMKEFSQIMFEQNVPVGFTMTDSGKFLLKFSFSSTYRNFLNFAELVDYVIHFDIEKGMYHQKQRPFDKLKELWDEWKHSKSKDFEAWVFFEKLPNNQANVDKWLAEHCGFLTTAEVRYAIQELKNK